MSGVTITVEGVDTMQRRFSGLVERPLVRLVTKAALLAEREAREGMVKDTSEGARSIVSEVNGLTGRVYSPLTHVAVMDQGRTAGKRMPPPEALVGWMRRHGMEGSPFPLARAIGRRGIKGRFFFRKAADKVERSLPGMLRDFAEDIKREAHGG